jgi:hypothetical protein
VSQHPLIDLAQSREVKQASAFRQKASELTGEGLLPHYEKEVANAPRRREAGKKYFVAWNKKLAAQRSPSRDGEHLAIALLQHGRQSGEPLPLPRDAGSFQPLHCLVPLRSAAVDRSLGDADPNKGVERIDLLGIGPEERLTVVSVKFLAPSATRGRTGDTPLRALLEGLANCAIAQANREALLEEAAGVTTREVADLPPALVLLGSPRYWELCRKREAQKGAAWIKEMERLAGEIEIALGIPVHYLSVKLEGDPGWEYTDGAPVVSSPPQLVPAWEIGAGRVKPKPRPRARRSEPEVLVVEADLSRPVRSYAASDSYTPGDRIQHPTLGLGVVQSIAGPGKINVLFDEQKSLLVHERSGKTASISAAAPWSGPSE